MLYRKQLFPDLSDLLRYKSGQVLTVYVGLNLAEIGYKIGWIQQHAMKSAQKIILLAVMLFYFEE